MKFSKGDQVRVIPNAANRAYVEKSEDTNLALGNIYTVLEQEADTWWALLHLEGHKRAHTYASRFELYYPCIEVQGVQPSNTFLDKQSDKGRPVIDECKLGNSVRGSNYGNSDYSRHKIQPWDIWSEYKLNPWDADIVKRILRTKHDAGMTKDEQRSLDYKKIIHICHERIRQLDT